MSETNCNFCGEETAVDTRRIYQVNMGFLPICEICYNLFEPIGIITWHSLNCNYHLSVDKPIAVALAMLNKKINDHWLAK